MTHLLSRIWAHVGSWIMFDNHVPNRWWYFRVDMGFVVSFLRLALANLWRSRHGNSYRYRSRKPAP